jgi:hypothetical protein
MDFSGDFVAEQEKSTNPAKSMVVINNSRCVVGKSISINQIISCDGAITTPQKALLLTHLTQ